MPRGQAAKDNKVSAKLAGYEPPRDVAVLLANSRDPVKMAQKLYDDVPCSTPEFSEELRIVRLYEAKKDEAHSHTVKKMYLRRMKEISVELNKKNHKLVTLADGNFDIVPSNHISRREVKMDVAANIAPLLLAFAGLQLQPFRAAAPVVEQTEAQPSAENKLGA